MKKALGAVVLAFVALMIVLTALAGPDHTTTQASASASLAPEPANPKRASSCRRGLDNLDRQTGAWKSYQRAGDFLTVEVRGTYYLADFDSKLAMDAMMRCVATNGRINDASLSMVSYLDSRTHKEVARWSKYTGFEVLSDN